MCLRSRSWVRATKVASAPRARLTGLNGRVERTERRRLGDLADLGGRRVLALGQAVDLVVEHEDRELHVAAQGVDEVIAADRERVAVAGHHPDVEIGSRHREAGRDRRGPAVDRVHAVGVHVVREAGGTADPGDEHRVLAPHAELGQQAAAPRTGSCSPRSPGTSAPPGRWPSPSGSSTGPRRRSSCVLPCAGLDAVDLLQDGPLDLADPEGRPCTCDSTFASTRNSERTRRVRWPRLPSGTRIAS